MVCLLQVSLIQSLKAPCAKNTGCFFIYTYMDSYYEFIVTIPSPDGNLAYEVFDKDFLTFCKLILRTTLKKTTILNPDQCEHYIMQHRNIFGCNQKLQLIADKLLNMSKTAKDNDRNISVLFSMHGL